MSNLISTSDAILNCARNLIIAGGYNGFSYADIASQVGIRKASIHHHFPTKVDLVRTLVSQYREEARAGIAAMERHVPDPLDQLRAYAGYWEACLMDARAPFCICALLASELTLLPEVIALEVRAHFRSLSAWLATVLERGAQQGRLHFTGPAAVVAERFLATVHGAMLSARAYGDPKVFGTVLASLIDPLAAQP